MCVYQVLMFDWGINVRASGVSVGLEHELRASGVTVGLEHELRVSGVSV